MSLAPYVEEFSGQPWRGLFLVSVAGLVFAGFLGRHSALPPLCGGPWIELISRVGPVDAASFLLNSGSVPALAVEWAAMVVAMMPLLLARPIAHVCRSVPRARIPRAVAAFVLGYGLLWMSAGAIILMLAGLLASVVSGSTAVAAALAIAVAWSASPLHQAALNRGHRVRRLGIFGMRADKDAFCFGLVHGGWCLAACWAWMLLPLVLADFHLLAMIIVEFIVLADRLAPPASLRWRAPPGLNVLAVAFTQVVKGAPTRRDAHA